MYRKELTYNRNKLIDAFKEKDYPLREKYADIFFGISCLKKNFSRKTILSYPTLTMKM